MTCFIVLESGSRWPDWVMGRRFESSWDIVEQHDGESPAELAVRVREQLLQREPSGLELAVIACNERSDDSAVACRHDIALAVAPRLAASARVVLTASERAGGESRRRLSELAQHLDSLCEGTGHSVTVSFGYPAEAAAASAGVP